MSRSHFPEILRAQQEYERRYGVRERYTPGPGEQCAARFEPVTSKIDVRVDD